MKKLLLLAGVISLASASQAIVLWDSENLINGSQTAGPVSRTGVAQGGTIGYSIRTQNAAGAADDFSVSGNPWTIQKLSFYAYSTLATQSFVFTNASWQIVSGGVNGTVVASAANVAVTNGGFIGYRLANFESDVTDRAIYKIDVAVNNLNLNAGNYWLRWSVNISGNGGAWQVWNVPDPQSSPGSGNAQQRVAGAPYTTYTGAGITGYDLPFTIEGTAVPEPGTMIALAAGISALAARRRRK